MTSYDASGRQPVFHDAVAALRAPTQVWSRPSGAMSEPVDGIYVSDLRVASGWRVLVDGVEPEPIVTLEDSGAHVRFVALLRGLDGVGADPDVRLWVERHVRGDGVDHVLRIESRLARATTAELTVELRAETTPVDFVKTGRASHPADPRQTPSGLAWGAEAIEVELRTDAERSRGLGNLLRLSWTVEVPARGSVERTIELDARDAHAVVMAPTRRAPWVPPALNEVDDRLRRWVLRALDDLDVLRLTLLDSDDEFLGAGAPWFFTLFGRDSIWAARFLLPLDVTIAHGTLRTLASLQGREVVPATAEQPGKIIHEVRRGIVEIPHEGIELPPYYYGTVDATPLWICLLADARDHGLGHAAVEELLPALESALAWMRDFGDSDGDGLLEYVDETGSGLSNQGWKDSGDSVQWRDGTLAEGPIALSEVQAYAYEAAMRGADLLDHFGRVGEPWRLWAARIAQRFREAFWVSDEHGRYPAIALDAHKRPVDTLTSNIGHLLGTGLLDDEESRLVASRLMSSQLDSGYGVRTLSTEAKGYWPLAYHGGSVWAHDTAIAIRGLHMAGFKDEARALSEGLLHAAAAFDFRMPELYGGDSAAEVPRPLPYPASCRPQAWSAAAAIIVFDALADPDAATP
ncbi:glycogen debranching N-terminal domain-containing protein [Salinibacterium sp. ZJ77]|uniref:glycogen debranching N-terminal domain-containing protein n=1 Tax=Salinibacterium sp. ZJ77 TaxID=2708337 RepID=UPI0014244902|nr:glycogen debranching N-terminal domain-containing protein [Salinibacterium sp. ZJ77]